MKVHIYETPVPATEVVPPHCDPFDWEMTHVSIDDRWFLSLDDDGDWCLADVGSERPGFYYPSPYWDNHLARHPEVRGFLETYIALNQ